MSTAVRLWLGIKRDVSVPCGPTRNVSQLTDKNLDHYHSKPDESGTFLDGNPFYLFWLDPQGQKHEEMIPDRDGTVEVGGRQLVVKWFDEVTGPGKLVVINGELNLGEEEKLAGIVGSNPNNGGLPEAYAYCSGWNNMCVSCGPLNKRACLRFGIPEDKAAY